MGELLVKEKEIVVPGEELAKGMSYLPGQGCYRKDDEVLSSKLGLVNVDGRAIKIIPLTGTYNPKRNDVIIGNVIDVSLYGWRIHTNSAYSAMLSAKDATNEFIEKGADLTQYINLGEYVAAKIIKVTSQKLIDLTMKGPGLRKLAGGRIIHVNNNKVPRIIGKQGSMISMIKDATGARIIVGQNGVAWIQGDPEGELIAINAIRMIEEQSHISGLTDRVKEYLDKACKGRPKRAREEREDDNNHQGEQNE